jgi:hypothetical protein
MPTPVSWTTTSTYVGRALTPTFARARVLDGVGHQVAEHLDETITIAHHRR